MKSPLPFPAGAQSDHDEVIVYLQMQITRPGREATILRMKAPDDPAITETAKKFASRIEWVENEKNPDARDAPVWVPVRFKR